MQRKREGKNEKKQSRNLKKMPMVGVKGSGPFHVLREGPIGDCVGAVDQGLLQFRGTSAES